MGQHRVQWMRTVTATFLEEFPITFFQELVDIISYEG